MSFHTSFGPEAALIIGLILVVAGLLLAFWGHGIWSSLMSLLGALIGGAVGYLFGASLGGQLGGLILAVIGAILGGILFAKLVKVGLAFLVGLLAAALVYSVLRGSARFTAGQIDPALAIALVVLIAVFALAYYFIDELIGVITAAIGGLLLGAGLWFLGAGTIIAALAGFGAFALGAVLQTTAIRRRRRARAYVPVAAPPPPPPSSP